MLKESVVLVYNYKSKFVDIDNVILSRRYTVKEVDLNENYFSSLFNFRKFKGVHVYWFVSFKTVPFILISFLLNNRIKIISGGFDISNIKGYGMFSTELGRLVQRLQFKLAETVLVNSRASYDELLVRLPDVSHKLCFLHHVLDYCPINTSWEQRDLDFVTVGSIKAVNMTRKGLSKFIDMARAFPLKKFVLVGPVIDAEFLMNIPENIKITGFVAEDDKLRILRRSKYYCQFSEHEGFGLSVLEAQVQGCFVLHNNVGGLKESVKRGKIIDANAVINDAALSGSIDYDSAIAINRQFDYSVRAMGLIEFVSLHHG